MDEVKVLRSAVIANGYVMDVDRLIKAVEERRDWQWLGHERMTPEYDECKWIASDMGYTHGGGDWVKRDG